MPPLRDSSGAERLPRFIFLNGPAGSGKATLGRRLAEIDSAIWCMKLSTPMYDMLSCIQPNELDAIEWTQEQKAAPLEVLPSVTARQFLIEADRFLHSFDPEILGKLLMREVEEAVPDFVETLVITDVRLPQNINCIIEAAGADECVLIRLFRPEHTWEGDIGGYITNDTVSCRCIDIHNSGTVDDLVGALLSALHIDMEEPDV